MKIDAKVQSISKLKDYFFLVPDYQRENMFGNPMTRSSSF